MVKYVIYETVDYRQWLLAQTLKSERQVLARIAKIEYEGHFGHHKYLDDELWELKFNDGRRVYYVLIPEAKIILVLGGNKNGQDKDIKKAKSIFRKIIKDGS
jgi:putative addiction module killer protein